MSGPWKIEKRDRLIRLRDLARVETAKGESRIDFALRFQRESGEIVDEDHPPPGSVRSPSASRTVMRRRTAGAPPDAAVSRAR